MEYKYSCAAALARPDEGRVLVHLLSDSFGSTFAAEVATMVFAELQQPEREQLQEAVRHQLSLQELFDSFELSVLSLKSGSRMGHDAEESLLWAVVQQLQLKCIAEKA